jgi:phosphomethylpyrimidine synthase
MTYKTQMEASRKGIVTREMKEVAHHEGMDLQDLLSLVSSGQVVIPANVKHKSLEPKGIGAGLRTKINVNLGVSGDCADYSEEMEKANLAIRCGAESIMDLSNYGKTRDFRTTLINMSPAIIGTVPIYDAIGYCSKDLKDITGKEFLDVVASHAKEGVDFMTIHAGVNKRVVELFDQKKRRMNMVSRGGSLTLAWMKMTGKENPFYEYFDDLLDILREYDVTISLGDGFRPGCIHDSTDAFQVSELVELGRLVERAWGKNVQVMVEGPGHMALDEISANVKLQKRLCHQAPFYVLGPIVTDIAPGYDHITSAIGGSIAAASGADFLCYVTPAEHLRLPDLQDVKEGIMAAKIAAHAGDIVKGVKGARDMDNEMSDARAALDWDAMLELALDKEKAQAYRQSVSLEDTRTCSMCGKMCAVLTTKKVLEDLDL